MVPVFFKVALRRFFWLLAAYTISRFVFLFWNWSTFSSDTFSELAVTFLHGLRFDTSAILFMNLPLLVLWLVPSQWFEKRWMRALDVSLFCAINLLGLAVNFVDVEFVNFIGKRSSLDLFFLAGDIERHSLSILMTYWYFVVGFVALGIVIAWFYPKFPEHPKHESWLPAVVWRLGFAFLAFTGMRGGYQFRPLSPMHAYFSSKHELGLLALNTPFNMIKSYGKGKFDHLHFFDSQKEMIRTLVNMSEPSRPPLALAKGWNVVVLIVESLSTEYMGLPNHRPGYTPFVDELTTKSFYFHHNYANARRSLEGIPAVLCGLPTMMEEPILTSNFTGDRFDCLPRLLRQQGYSTYFLHGTHNGSMHMDMFSGLAGFEHFVGLNEYPKDNKEDSDDAWGVLDEPMLQYAVRTIDEAKKPVMLSVFTLSSHHPYYVPPKYRGKFPKGTLEIHETMGYADYSLRKFFETASTRPWFNHTIFVVTGDHTQKTDLDDPEFTSFYGYYRVPLIIYVPGLKNETLPYDPKRITQHVDIVPTVMDLLGVRVPDRLLFGQSVFDTGLVGRAYNYTSYNYWYEEPELMVDMGRPPNPLRTYTYKDIKTLIPADPQAEKFAQPTRNLKAVIQYMHDGLFNNSLYEWRKAL
jgi:phosphoglycerol transferase MdoB-like AlkP superfamily enzyme